MYPNEVHCRMKCIAKQEMCIFVECCGYRKTFLTTFARKQNSSMRRYQRNHNCTSQEAYISVTELVKLARVYMMTGFKCWYCGKKMQVGVNYDHDACTIDHRIPLCRGGTNAIENIVYCCHECNMKKGEGEYA